MCLYKFPRPARLKSHSRSWQCADLKRAHALRDCMSEATGSHLDHIYVSSFDGTPRVEVSTLYPARVRKYEVIANRFLKEQIQ